MNNPDHISESLETISWVTILNFFDVNPGSRIRDGKILIRYKHPGCATLHANMRQYKDDRPGCGRAALAAFPSGWAASAPGCLSPPRALRVVTHTHLTHMNIRIRNNLREKVWHIKKLVMAMLLISY
jgi:hypothetical protein